MMRSIDKLILHCSDSDVAAHDDISVIREWHTLPKEEGGRGWKDVGYHKFIKSDGTVQRGRDDSAIGAHCYGQNRHSLGYCLHGKTQFTEAQFKALAEELRKDLLLYPDATIHGHNEFADKECPRFDVDDFIEDYMSNIDTINIKNEDK